MPNINDDGSLGTGPGAVRRGGGRQPINPYTAHDLAGARAVIETGKDTLELIAKCQRCGNDFAAAIPNVQAMMEYAEGILREFGSGTDTNV